VLRAARRTAQPWRNGGGLTREIAAHPPGSTLEDFDWRISTAEVTAAGPFSPFPGIDRTLAVLAGELSLVLDGKPSVTLSTESAPLSFPGDAPASASPVTPAVTDLNVMTRRGAFSAKLERCPVEDAVKFAFTAITTILIAGEDLVLKIADEVTALAPLDAVRIQGPLRCELSTTVPGACLYRIEISPAS
jgi:uncharacterized protein